MTAIRDSLIYRRLLALWAWFGPVWHESAVGRWFHRRRVELEAAGKTSRFCAFAVGPGALRRSWETSRVKAALSALFGLPVTVAGGVYRRSRGLWEGSVCFKALRALGSRGWLVMGVFTLIMLMAPHGMWDNVYAFLLAVAALALYAVGCAGGEKTLELGRMGPWFALYFVFITLGFVCSLSVPLSLRFYLFHLTGFLIVLLAVSTVDRYEQLRAMLIFGAVGLAVAALYGCYQGMVGVEVVASQQDVVLNKDMPGRIYGFFDNPNNFAEVLVMLLPLTGALTLNAKGRRGRVLGACALVLGLVAIGMTYSRSSWIGLVLAVGVALALTNWRFVPGLLVLGVCAIPFLPQTIWNRILTIGNMDDTSAQYRIAIWEDTRRLLGDYGLTGTGLGSDVMGKVFRHYPTLYDGNYPIHTHNNYFQMWGEVGVFGLLAFVGLVLGQLKEGLQAYSRADKDLRRIIAAALGSLVGISVIGFVEYTWFYPRNMFLFWFLFGVLAAGVKLVAQGGQPKAGKTA